MPAAAGTAQPFRALASRASGECSTGAADEAQAAAMAARCHQKVEVIEARTEHDTLFATPDGTMQLDVAAAAIRTHVGEEGGWRDIDTTVVQGDGRIEVAAPATEMSFSDGSQGEPLARIERDGHELTLDMPFDLPAPSLRGDSVTYGDVLPGVDLVVTVGPDGTSFSEVLRVQTPEAADNPALRELAMPLQTSDGLMVTPSNDGGFEAATGDGSTVFTGQPPQMWDSAADRAAFSSVSPLVAPMQLTLAAAEVARHAQSRPEAPAAGDAVAPIPMDVTQDDIVLTLPTDVLDDPDTVWPVYIDPSVGSDKRSEWMAVRDSGGGVEYMFPGDEGVGYCNTAQLNSGSCSPYTFTSRLMWEFSGMSELANLQPANIISASFTANGTNAYSCTASLVQLYRVNDFTSATTFASSGPWTSDRLVQAIGTTHRPGCADPNAQPRPIEFDIRSIATWAATNHSTAIWIGLKGAYEDNMVEWKRYGYDAVVSIVYNRPPATPTKLTMVVDGRSLACPATANPSSPLRIPGTTSPVTFSAVLSDPDGGNLRANINAYDSAGQRIWNPPMTSGQASGSMHRISRAFPGTSPAFQEGVTYYWDVDATDDQAVTAWSPKSQRCYFQGDYTGPPVAPAVTGPSTARLGEMVTFQVTPPSSDTVEYWYSVDSDGRDMSVKASGGTITVPAGRTGNRFISVEARDAAGNRSPEADRVPFTVSPVRAGDWQLDEQFGSMAADAVGAHPLALGPGVSRVPGALAQPVPGHPATDLALKFTSIDQTAATTVPVIDTRRSFTVVAYVKLDSLPASSATAVSQDGYVVSGFSLGARASDSCPAGTSGLCWSFFMYPSDMTDTPVQVASTVPVELGTWVALVGIYDADSHTMRLDVHEDGGRRLDDTRVVPFTSNWNANGALRLNGGKAFGSLTRTFPGEISGVRVYPGALTNDDDELSYAKSNMY